MLLESISDSAIEVTDAHSLTFAMRDRKSGKLVRIIVDGITLEDLAEIDNAEHDELRSLFKNYRSHIEEIANNKYAHDEWDGETIEIYASDI